MSIDQLIRDLIEEDQFKAKYTTRQRSIFCKNMYAKVSQFIEETNESHLDRIEELEEELQHMKSVNEQNLLLLEEVKEELEVANNDLEVYKKANEELNRGWRAFFWDFLAAIRLAIYLAYLCTVWQYYIDKAEMSMKDINNKRVVPYRIA